MKHGAALLYLLAAANFAVGIGAFGVIGLVTPVGGSFALSATEASWMMSLYALVYSLSSPVLVAIGGGMNRARLLVAGLGVLPITAPRPNTSSSAVTPSRPTP